MYDSMKISKNTCYTIAIHPDVLLDTIRQVKNCIYYILYY